MTPRLQGLEARVQKLKEDDQRHPKSRYFIDVLNGAERDLLMYQHGLEDLKPALDAAKRYAENNSQETYAALRGALARLEK